MASEDIGAVLNGVETLFNAGTVAGLSDFQLLERCVSRADEGAEAAFAALVKRHGPMVLRVCRGELQNLHSAEDAFQATFLILARKARSIRKGGSLASWLYGVARRVARRARVDRARRAARQQQSILMAGNPVLMANDPPELIPEIQEEVDRLPEKYRAPIILCYLEGLTHEEAASQLRVPVGTVKIRLSRGRERLRGPLVRRGLAPVLIASALSTSTRGSIPLPLLDTTVRAAMQSAAVQAAGGSVAVAALVEGVLNAMFFARLRTISALVAASMTMVLTSLFLVAVLSPTVRSDQEPTPAKPQVVVKPTPMPVTTAPKNRPELGNTLVVKKSVFHRTTTQPGTVQPINSVNIHPKVSGYIKTVLVNLGDSVKNGDKLVVIDAPELRLELKKAKAVVDRNRARLSVLESRIREAEAASKSALAQIDAAKAESNQAESNRSYREKHLKRLTELVARKAVEERLADEAVEQMRMAQAASLAAKAKVLVEQANLESAQAKVQSARSEVMEAREDLSLVNTDLEKAQMAVDSCEIRSPIDGVVTRCNYQEGDFAQAAGTGNAQPLLTIVYAKAVWIVVQVPDRDAPYLDRGDPITFWANALPTREYKGTITRDAFAEDPSTGTVRAQIGLNNADGRLRPGQSGQVIVNLEDHPDAIVIPISALVEFGGPNLAGSCYRVVEGHNVLTPIKLGALNRDNGTVEVLDGLKEGDSILPDVSVIPPVG